jgi:Bacterial antitoxin of type II TA system, VapB
MKTTIELSDALLAQARQHARARHTTLKALIEQGLRAVLTKEEEEKPFKLRDMSVDGNGMTPEFQNMTWEQKLEFIYEGRI